MANGVYGENGIRYTAVSGSSWTGLYAADGSFNVVLDDTSFKGLYHPCGAFRVNTTNSFNNTYDATGAYYLSNLLASVERPTNYMSFSEDPTQFTYLTGGAGAAIPHVFSNGSTLVVGTKQALPDLPGGEVGKGFTCTGMCQDPDSTDIWVGNFGSTRGGAGGVSLPISLVRLSADGSTLVTQVQTVQGIGGLQGVAFVTSQFLRCLAYADGSSGNIYFMNRDGTTPRANLTLPFAVNALTWDDARQGLWVSNAANGDVWLVSLEGVYKQYADFNSWGGPIDHIAVDPSRGTAGYIWTTSGANGSPGILIAWDVAKDRIVDRFLLDSAQAVEGIIVSGTSVKVVTDGYYHSTGSAPNTSAPFNVNEFQTYTASASLTQWRYARAFKAGEIVGPYSRQPYHLILDRGDSDTSADFCFVTRAADASINGQVANMAWTGKSFSGGTVNMGMRLLGGASATNFTFGASYVRRSYSATFTSGANNTQLGTRGTQTTDRQIDVIGSALSVNLGSAIVPYKPRLGS